MDGPSPYCPILRSDTENPVILRCGHLFDKDELIKTLYYRHAACPLCSAPFTTSDFMPLTERVVNRIKMSVHKAAAGTQDYFLELYNEMTSNKYFIFPTVYLSIIPSTINTCLRFREVKNGECSPVLAPCRFLALEVIAGVLSIYAQTFNACFRPQIVQEQELGTALTGLCRRLIDFGQISMTIGNPLLVMGHLFANENMEQVSTSCIAGGALVSWGGSGIYMIRKSWDERTSSLQFFSRVCMFAFMYGSLCLFVHVFLLAANHELDS